MPKYFKAVHSLQVYYAEDESPQNGKLKLWDPAKKCVVFKGQDEVEEISAALYQTLSLHHCD